MDLTKSILKKAILYFLLVFFVLPFQAQIQTYYDGLDLTKTGNELFLELSSRIKQTHVGIPYTDSTTDTWDVLKKFNFLNDADCFDISTI